MSNDIRLDSLEKVDVRTIWEREDKEFTPWLAREENIALLGKTIGFELEVQEEEVSVGPFRADILCRDTVSAEMVIIENQLEKTDHTHLGQTLTYAAGLDAVTIIWIALRFVEEHRAALDWLNRITHEKIRFFGIEIEAWKIGDSLPAVKFNIVAKPNDWSKTVKDTSAKAKSLTERQKVLLAFWTQFGAFLEQKETRFNPPTPYQVNWVGWGIGRTGTSLEVVVNANEINVRIFLDGGRHPTWFHKLQDEKDKIEAELGFKLLWEEKKGFKASYLTIRKKINTHSNEDWIPAFTWLLEHMEVMDRVFRPRIAGLYDEPMPEELEE